VSADRSPDNPDNPQSGSSHDQSGEYADREALCERGASRYTRVFRCGKPKRKEMNDDHRNFSQSQDTHLLPFK
jgi:hypothetical protein